MNAATVRLRAATLWTRLLAEHGGVETLLEMLKPVLVGVFTVERFQHGQWAAQPLDLGQGELVVAGYLVLSQAIFWLAPRRKRVLFPLSLLEATLVALIYAHSSESDFFSFRILVYLAAAGMGARLSPEFAGVAASGIWAMTSLRALIWGEVPLDSTSVLAALLGAGTLLLAAMLGNHLVTMDRLRARHQAEAAAVYEMTRAVSASLDPQVVTRTLTHAVSQIFGGCSCVIAFADDESASLLVAEAYPHAQQEARRLPLAAGGLLVQAFGSQRPAVSEHAADDPSLGWLAEGGAATALAAPLILKQETRGVIAVVAADGRRFDQHHVRLLETAAAHAATAIDHARLYEEAERETVVLSRLYEFSRALSETHGVKHRLHVVAEMSKRLVGGESAVVLAPDPLGNLLAPIDFSGSAAAALSELILARDDPVLGPILEEQKPVVAPAGLGLPDSDTKSYAIVPLSRNRRLSGVLLVVKPGAQSITPSDLQVLFMVAQHGTLSVENARRFEDAQHWAVSDGLTGLANHRHFQERLRQEVSEAERYNTPLAMIMMDVDYFKRLNDTEGHPRGDALLRAVGGVIRSQCRRSDVLARYGGDEFAVIATHTSAVDAAVLAERIRAQVEALTEIEGVPLGAPVTLSLGVAAYPDHARSAAELVDAADRAMAAAKQAGRNRMVMARPVEPVATAG
jgi:diguanylate cyclase (GGDEF)-like protein